MTTPDNSGPAFPVPNDANVNNQEGMTLRQYAAIKLKVPDSGTDWLDDMIKTSLLDEFAGKAMPIAAGGLNQRGEDFVRPDQYSQLAQDAYKMADAMMKARQA